MFSEVVTALIPLFTLAMGILIIAGFSLDIQALNDNKVNMNQNRETRAALAVSIVALAIASLAVLLVLVHWICKIPGNPLCGGEGSQLSALRKKLAEYE